MVPVSHLRSPTSQPQPIGLLLQLDSVPYCRSPPPGSGIAAATGTADLTAAAMGSSIYNRCGEHGPLGLCLQHPSESGQSSPGGVTVVSHVGVEVPQQNNGVPGAKRIGRRMKVETSAARAPDA
ncbi:hypothetical protein ILYODFUR_009672 [Ilyodon furcidens]|uniref:Uncharacterized protein n=1 Tax=Ilyodon furcidens TaxID=33524 RepID=A0ABV0THC7_9TELE